MISARTHATWGVPVTLFVLVAVSSVMLPVIPWPRDHWVETQYLIFGSHTDTDNYSPIAAPAFLFAGIARLASIAHLDLRGEFYLASLVQSGMLFCSLLMIYAAMRRLQLPHPAVISIVSLCFVLSTGLPQTLNSENVCFFLTASLLYASARMYSGSVKGVRFAAGTVVIGATVGLLVLTRMIPVIFIPGLIWLFAKHTEPKRLLLFGGTVTALTASMLLWLIATNHDRFGRYELTSSNGRHLWQGAKEIVDRGLAHVADYQALKKADPKVGGAPRRFMPWNEGRNHWEVPYPDEVPGLEHFQSPDVLRDRQKDALLRTLAIEAIRTEPLLYLASGAFKFLQTIGATPYQLGFVMGMTGFWNPLNVSEPLPALASDWRLVSDGATAGFRKGLDLVHQIGRVLYPVAICFVAVSLLAMGGISHRARFRPGPLPLIVFGICATGFAAVACLLSGTIIERSLAFALSIAMILTRARTLATVARHPESGPISEATFPHQRLYACLAMLFFGSLWISWQVEVALSRYAVPYLPLLILMLGVALCFWRALDGAVAMRRRAGAQ